MSAEELAKEIVAMSRLRDRPSPLLLVVYSRSMRSRDIRNSQETMRIEAPVEDGKCIVRIFFPVPNYNNLHDSNHVVQQTILDYDAENNVAGAAACIEGYMSYRDKRDVMLFPILDGQLGTFPLSRWTLELNESGKTASRTNTLEQILNVLLVKS